LVPHCVRRLLLSYMTFSFSLTPVSHHASQAGRGGQVIMFQGVIPTLGMGQLEPVHMESTLHKTEKERPLYSPRNVFWKNIADECADEGIGISMFLAPSSFLDVASISKSIRFRFFFVSLRPLKVTRFPSLGGSSFITHVSALNGIHMCCTVSWVASCSGRQFTTV
jgi:hypothetical protein